MPLRHRTLAPTLAGILCVGCGGGGGSPSSSSPTELPLFARGSLQGRAALSSPPITVQGNGMTVTALVGEFVAMKAVVPEVSWKHSRIVFSSNRNGVGQIFIMDADGSDATQVTSEIARAAFPKLSPDGQKITYTLIGPSQWDVFVINIDGTGRTAITNTPTSSEGFSTFGPGGLDVAYQRAETNNSIDIWKSNIATKVATKLSNIGTAQNPEWDVRRNIIYYRDAPAANWTSITPTGSAASGTTVPPGGVELRASPVSAVLAYSNGESTFLKIPDVTERPISTPPFYDLGGFSPDGRYVLGTIVEGGLVSLYRMDPLTLEKVRVSQDYLDYFNPHWGSAPLATTLIGSSTALGLNASGFIYAEKGDFVSGALAFKATTPSTVVVATDDGERIGSNIVYTVDADNISELSYANGSFFKPIRVIGSGGSVGNADGAIVSINAETAKIVSVIAFVGTRTGRPSIEQQGVSTVMKGSFTAVFDSKGKVGGAANHVVITSDGKVEIR